MNAIDKIFNLFSNRGDAAYFGEKVSQTEHALQSAHLARLAGASVELITAALLHDIGHLLAGLAEDAAEQGVDDTHEGAGATWLADDFGEAVAAPVRLHVAAKRYLCAVDSAYEGTLSDQSRLSLELQGGPMTPDEIRRFQRETWFEAAVTLRRRDDQAKIPGLKVPPMEEYRGILEEAHSNRRSQS